MKWPLVGSLYGQAMLIFLLPLIILLSACGKRIHVTSNTFADTQIIPRGFPKYCTFYIEHDKKLLSKEIAQKISWILEEKGYRIVDQAHADYYITFDAKLTSEKRVTNVAQWVPGEKQTTTGCVHGDKRHECQGTISYQEETETAGKIVYVPQEYIVFHRKLFVQAYDTAHKEQIWESSAISTGESDDLRDIIDYLLVTAFKQFGRSSHHKIESSLRTKDEEVTALRRDIFSGW